MWPYLWHLQCDVGELLRRRSEVYRPWEWHCDVCQKVVRLSTVGPVCKDVWSWERSIRGGTWRPVWCTVLSTSPRHCSVRCLGHSGSSCQGKHYVIHWLDVFGAFQPVSFLALLSAPVDCDGIKPRYTYFHSWLLAATLSVVLCSLYNRSPGSYSWLKCIERIQIRL